MASVDRKWLPPALIAVAGLASVAVYHRVPAMVDLRFERLLPFPATQPTDLAPRWLALSFVPVIALIAWVGLRLAPTAGGQRLARRLFWNVPDEVTSPAQFDRFSTTYDTIVLAVVMLILGFHAAVLAFALQVPGVAVRIVSVVLGASLLLMGNVMPRLRPNWVAGLRTKRLLSDPQLWRSAHRTFGSALVASGFVTIIVALLAPTFGLLVGIASMLVSSVIGFVSTKKRSGTVSESRST